MSKISDIIANRLLREAVGATEEDVKMACERILREELSPLGICYAPKYEFTISSGRLDALFNSLVIEYKKRGLLAKSFDAFVTEKTKYIPSLAKELRTDPTRIICVLLDGESIGFFRCSEEHSILSFGPYPVNEASVDQLIRYAKSTNRKSLSEKNVISSFGHGSVISRAILNAMYEALSHISDQRTRMFLNEWKRLFGQVAGKVADNSIQAEAAAYGLEIHNYGEAIRFVFAVHTTFALIIKHIALYVLRSKNALDTLSDELKHGKQLKDLSTRLESGEEYKALGINNFLEGDYFCWYTFEWSDSIETAIHLLLNEIDEYEPETASLKPESIRDLIKGLYEGLLSKKMRHSLGEYYSPDWMAQYVLDQSSYRPGQRLLDPTCGSGTFLVMAIQRCIAEQLPLKDILDTVYGIDMNPLAVLSARTNYILSIEPLLKTIDESIEIPIYLGDAIFSPTESNGFYSYYLDTDAGRISLSIPSEILAVPGFFQSILSKIEELIDCRWQKQTISLEAARAQLYGYVMEAAKAYGLQFDPQHIVDLFDAIDSLEENRWDGIWCNVIKNYFATACLPAFDVIVGNPPWVRWSELPEAYRNTIKAFCKSYNLFSSDRFVGGVESDISTMVLYSAADKWLKDKGTLSMLITRTVFKTESSEGFRCFSIPTTGIKLKVCSVDDFTALRPFDNAVNKPTLLTLKKNHEETVYPVEWRVWTMREPVSPEMTLFEVKGKTDIEQKVAAPIGGKGSPWLTVPPQKLAPCLSLTKRSTDTKAYIPRKGICTDLNGVYYGTLADGVFTNSFGEVGKTKGLVPERVRIENALLYPIARGREIGPFSWNGTGKYGIIPQTGMHGFSVEDMLLRYPRAFAYFSRHKEILETRSSLKRYLKKDPFYTCWNVGEYSFAAYKVCWSEISSTLKACVLNAFEGKTVVPDHKVYFVPTEDEMEAHYLCAVLNAPSVEELVMNYAENTQIGTHIFDYVRIPRFDPANPVHTLLSRLSKSAHENRISVENTRQEIDRVIAAI